MEEKEREEILARIQLTEQALQNLLLQKQSFQLELLETENALSEVKSTKGDVFKIVGPVLVKAKKEDLIPELEKKKEILELRIKSIEKQEQEMKEKLTKEREEALKKLK
ncbi:MAG TPA: prefoldin subunit beta [Candidatus Pacearchaeota archaeon]|nr:prefoldin subunit beta [Candidatus Pacearchaeota archaeon]